MKLLYSLFLFVVSFSSIKAQEPVFDFPVKNPIVLDTLQYYELTTCTYPKYGEYLYVDKYGGWLQIVSEAKKDNLKIGAKDLKGTLYTIDENSGRVLYVNKYYGDGKISCSKTISKPSYKEVVTNHYTQTSDGKDILTKSRSGKWERTVAYTSKRKVANGYEETICPYCKGTGFRYANVKKVDYGVVNRLGFKKYLNHWKNDLEIYERKGSDYTWGSKNRMAPIADEFIDFYKGIQFSNKTDDISTYMNQLHYEWIQVGNSKDIIAYAYYNVLETIYKKEPNIALEFYNSITPTALADVLDQISMRDKEQLKFYIKNNTNSALSDEVKGFFNTYLANPENVAQGVTDIGLALTKQNYKGEALYLKFTSLLKEVYNIDHYAVFRILMVSDKKTSEETLKLLPNNIKEYVSGEAKTWLKEKKEKSSAPQTTTAQSTTQTKATPASTNTAVKDYSTEKITASYNTSASLYVRKINDSTVYFYQNNKRINQPLKHEIIEDGNKLKLYATYTKDYYCSYSLNDMSYDKLYPLTNQNDVNYLYVNKSQSDFLITYKGKVLSKDQYEYYKGKDYISMVKIKSDNSHYLLNTTYLNKWGKVVQRSSDENILFHLDNNQFVFVEKDKPTQLNRWKVKQEGNKYYLINDTDKRKYSMSDYESSFKWGFLTKIYPTTY